MPRTPPKKGCPCGHGPEWHFPFNAFHATVKTWGPEGEEGEQTHEINRSIGCLLCLRKGKADCWSDR